MTYALGIDLGTTYTAAGIARGGRAEVAALGYRATSVPTVVFLRDDGEFLVGDAAERRAAQEPDRVAREFKRRVGDPTPLLLGGTPVAVDRCLAEVLRWVTATVAEAEGGPPAAVTVTHPANWGEFKRDVLREALRLVDLPAAGLLAEPVAAATWYAQAERLAPGRAVAVYDLGGGTFDAAVLRRRPDGGFESLGRAEGIERLGGIDVDEAVLAHVLRALGADRSVLGDVTDDDPSAAIAAAQLRRACVDAKEALSSETSVTIPVWLRNVHHSVLLQRTELEQLVGPLLRPTVDALARVVASAGLRPEDVDAVLLVGGSSRIPLVARLVSAGIGRPVAVDAHPKHPVALGAALDAGTRVAARPAATMAPPAGSWAPPSAPPTGPPPIPAPPRPASPPRPAFGPPPQDAPPPYPPPAAPPAPRRRTVVAAGLAAVVVLALVAAATLLRDKDDPGTAGASDSPPATGTVPGSTSTTATSEPAGDETPAGPVDLFSDPTPALGGLQTVSETTPRVRELVLYRDFAMAEVQVPGQPTFVDEYTWRDGGVEGPEPVSLLDMEVDELETKLYDLTEIDPAVIPGLGPLTLARCPGEGIELTHMIIDREFNDEGEVRIRVYASHPERGGGGYVSYALDGTEVANYCS